MIRITTAEPAVLPATQTSADAPLWQDQDGNFYRVASGLYDDCPDDAWVYDSDNQSPAPQATPASLTRVAGMEGRAALLAMGLVP